MSANDEAQLIEAIYEAALEPSVLDDVLAWMRARVGATANLCFATSPEGPRPWHLHGFDAGFFAAYTEHYHDQDIYIEGALARGLMQPCAVLPGEVLVDNAAVRRSAMVNELLYPNDFGRMCASPVHMAPQGMVALTFLRRRGAEPFGEEDVAFLQAIVPHFGRAARLRLRLEQQTPRPSWTLELLDTLPWGVILLDVRERPLLVNREAERILRQPDGLRLDRRGLFAEHPDDTRRLRRALASTLARAGDGAWAGADVQLRRPSGARPLLLTIVPVGRSVLPKSIGPGPLRAMVHVFDPASRRPTPIERLRALYGLTPAEARLACEMLGGSSLQDAADKFEVAIGTARNQLKQIFAKTDTRRQAELVRLLLTSPVLG
jgi:DNA-binding CsgD family transcriptional regulator/PAS domain-containing protein